MTHVTAFVLLLGLLQPAPQPRHAVVDFRRVPDRNPAGTPVDMTFRCGPDVYQTGFHLPTNPCNHPDFYAVLAQSIGEDNIRLTIDKGRPVFRVYGSDASDGRYYPIDRCDIWTSGLKADQRPRVTNPPPRPVRFSFGKLPDPLPNESSFTLGFRRPDGSKVAVEVRAPAGAAPGDVADRAAKAFVAANVRASVPKAGLVEVVGWSDRDGTLLPALGGTIAGTGVKTDQLPQVNGPPAPLPRAVIDLSPVEPGAAVAVRVQAVAVGGASFDRTIRAAGRAALVRAVEAELVDAGFQAWAEGDRVMVYGWANRSAQLSTVTGAWVTADGLPTGARPRVEMQGDIPPPTAPPPRPKR